MTDPVIETTPGGSEETNDALIRLAKADPANWRKSETPGLPDYYVGPQMQGDGTIDWSGHDGWPT